MKRNRLRSNNLLLLRPDALLTRGSSAAFISPLAEGRGQYSAFHHFIYLFLSCEASIFYLQILFMVVYSSDDECFDDGGML